MNWGVLWYIDFADWSVISPCTEAIQTCVKFLVGTRSFTLYVLVQFYGKSEFCENGGFSLSGSHIIYAVTHIPPTLIHTHKVASRVVPLKTGHSPTYTHVTLSTLN